MLFSEKESCKKIFLFIKFSIIFCFILELNARTIGFSIFNTYFLSNHTQFLSIFLVVLFFLKSNIIKEFRFKINYFNFFWFLLSLLLVISIYINENDFSVFLNFILLIPLVFFHTKTDDEFAKIFLLSIIIGSISFVIIPFIGYVYPANNLANIYICFYFSANIYLLNYSKSKNKYFFFLVLLLVSFTLIFITESRTTLISLFVSSILFYYKIAGNQKKNLFFLIKESFKVFFLIGIFFLFLSEVINLFFNKWGSQDITSGRMDIWLYTLDNGFSWLGNGANYFKTTFAVSDAHNIFVQIFGEFGILILILFVIIMVIVVCNIGNSNYLPFLIGYFTLGLSENIQFISIKFTVINLLFLLLISQVIFTNKKKEII